MRTILTAAAAAVLLAAGCDARDPIEPGAPYTFVATGQVHTLTGGVPAGLVASVAGPSGTSTVPVGANGRFTIQAEVTGDSVDVLIDGQPGAARTVIPSLIRVRGRSPGQNLTVVLVPAQWAIQGGTHHGTVSAISVDAGFRPPCSTANDSNCDGFYPIEWLTGTKLWPAAALPIRLAFDRARSHQAISASDSTTFWNAVNLMNTDMGTVLFQPARVEELTFAQDGRPNNAVVVRVDTTLAGFAAFTSWWWNGAGDLVAGVIRPRTITHLRNAGTMTHELMHTQGFKHSCSWSTVLGGYGCASAVRLTESDVAHAQVAFETHARMRATGATHGLAAALQGERVVLHGLPRLPAAAAQRLDPPFADLQLHGDSIVHADHAH